MQVADETGRLAQQYSATRLEPLPGNQLAMREPRALIYQKDGRVLTLAARKGVAFVPRRALESGTLENDVEVRLFKRHSDGSAIDVDRDRPAVVVTADQAQFDGVTGEVRCERAVRVATEAGSFAGEGLSLVLDGESDGVERLVIDRAIEPIRIDRMARSRAANAPSDARKAEAPSGGSGDAAVATRFIGTRQKSSDLQRLAQLVRDAAAASAPSALRSAFRSSPWRVASLCSSAIVSRSASACWRALLA